MIEVLNLTKCYNKGQVSALDNISFSVDKGEIVGFVGLNGAGKTTTIRLASGIILPSTGTVRIDKYDITTEKQKASQQIGWVPEYPNFDENAKAKNLLLYFAGFKQIQSDAAQKRAAELFQQLELTGHENKRLKNYSQGMKKRFSLALALLSSPNNYLFDEILNGLDPQGIRFTRSLLTDLKKEGKSVLLSSHILSEIEAISDRIVFIHKGRIIKSITRQELNSIEQNDGVLRMTIPNISESGLEYLRTLGKITVEDTSNITLFGLTDDPSIVSAELIKRGFLIRKFSFEKTPLEDYFFKLVGESNGSGQGA